MEEFANYGLGDYRISAAIQRHGGHLTFATCRLTSHVLTIHAEIRESLLPPNLFTQELTGLLQVSNILK
jgi:hypothetical protein